MYLNPSHILPVSIAGRTDREQSVVVEYLPEENRVLRELLGDKRPWLYDGQRCRLAVKGRPLGRKLLSTCCCIGTPDRILRWHPKLVAMKCHGSLKRGPGRPRVLDCIRRPAVRMARENRTWGYERTQGALANVGYTICVTTVIRPTAATVVWDSGRSIPPPPGMGRRYSWSYLREGSWPNAFPPIDL